MAPRKQKGNIDWAADAHFDKTRAMIYVEHSEECPIYKEKAVEFLQFLQENFPDRNFELVCNRDGKFFQAPRQGAFEISFAQNARTSRHNLWSGVTQGPPRKLKFPENFHQFLPEVTKVLKKIYVEVKLEFDDGPPNPSEPEPVTEE